MSKISQILLKNKFRGCLLGTLVGDCFGAPFIGDSLTSKVVLQKYFDKLDGPYFKAPVKKYSKDTVLTKCVAQALVNDPAKLDATKLSKLFVKEYFTDPKRDYGAGTATIFHKLRANTFKDPFKPATEETGSSDNGAVSRVAPIALFYHDNYEQMINVAKTSTELTHVHKHGITGALLYCIAIQQNLLANPSDKLDTGEFTKTLISKLKHIEKDDEGLGIGYPTPFTTQMELVQQLLQNKTKLTDEEVVEHLGHGVLAIYSVPTAIYCFLRAQSEIENIQTSNLFRRTLQYSISLGGETTTITALAGGIAGAYFGTDSIGQTMIQHCENNDVIIQLADQLFQAKFKT